MSMTEIIMERDALKQQLANATKQIVMLREFVKLLRDYIPASAIGNMTVQEALAATADLSDCILCDAEPYTYSTIWEDGEATTTPLYKAKEKP